MEFAQPRVALGAVDQGGDAGGERGAADHLGDMMQDALDPLARRARGEVGRLLAMENVEGIGDQVELLGPMPVDRRFADARPSATGSVVEAAETVLANP